MELSYFVLLLFSKVNSNGIVTLGVPFDRRQPPPTWDDLYTDSLQQPIASGGLVVLSALWTDSDITYQQQSVSPEVYYHQYAKYEDDVDQTLNRASEDALLYGGYQQFEATWVLVVTWVDMMPRLHRSDADQASLEPVASFAISFNTLFNI